MSAWPLNWSHGQGWVESLGGMLGPVHFQLPDGRRIQPFAVFPWAEEALPSGQTPLSGLISRGRGEWPCVPFGLNANPEALGWQHPIHGESAHGLWMRVDTGDDPSSLHLRYRCSADGPVELLERHIRGVAGEARIDCRLTVQVRRPCTLPIGLHPTLRLPSQTGALVLHPGRFAFALSYPHEVEPGADILMPNQMFLDLGEAPRNDGGSVDLRAYPLAENTESLVQLCGLDGQIGMTNAEEAYRFDLSWDARQLPSCLLWISNAGRRDWPWSRRHYAIGIEPVCSAFDLGVSASVAENAIARSGIPTALSLHPDRPLIIDYRMSVCAAPSQFES
jgi:hypothetical protein